MMRCFLIIYLIIFFFEFFSSLNYLSFLRLVYSLFCKSYTSSLHIFILPKSIFHHIIHHTCYRVTLSNNFIFSFILSTLISRHGNVTRIYGYPPKPVSTGTHQTCLEFNRETHFN